jgi:hypothetical protein
VIECEFEDPKSAEAIGFSHGEFGFVVQALNDAAGKELLSTEIVEDQFAVLTERPGDLLHGFDTGTHGLPAPLIEELCGPGGGVVIPELLKGFLEKVSADGPEVISEEVTQAEALFSLQILFAFEQEPALLLQ